MNDNKYFDNIHIIEEIISQLDEGELTPEEAKKLFETAKRLIDECEAILNSYSGTVEEISFVPTGT
ncbi:MAG: exodeoxyribonuclease VII small subunit [Methanothrix soehngenii]|jgi:exodeoxyribonuclease VII small subunit